MGQEAGQLRGRVGSESQPTGLDASQAAGAVTVPVELIGWPWRGDGPRLREGAALCFAQLWTACGCRAQSAIEVHKSTLQRLLWCSDRSIDRYVEALDAAGLVHFRGCRRGWLLLDLYDPAEVANSRGWRVVEADRQRTLPGMDTESWLRPADGPSAELTTDPRILRMPDTMEGCPSADLSSDLSEVRQICRNSVNSVRGSDDRSADTSDRETAHGRGEPVGSPGRQSAEVDGNTAVASPLRTVMEPGARHPPPPASHPPLCVSPLQEVKTEISLWSKSKDVSGEILAPEWSGGGARVEGHGPEAEAWQRLRVAVGEDVWECYLSRCQPVWDGGRLVILAPGEFFADRVRAVCRRAGVAVVVHDGSGDTPASTDGRLGEPTYGAADRTTEPRDLAADNGRVWYERIRLTVERCGGRGDTALPDNVLSEASRIAVERPDVARRFDTALEKLQRRHAAEPLANPGGWLNTTFSEICHQAGLPWRLPRKPK
jgi:hypothetical protein